MKRAARRMLILAALASVASASAAQTSPATTQTTESPSAYVQRVRLSYVSLDYERCVADADAAMKAPLEPAQIAQLHLYRALCEHGLGREDAAAATLKVALALDPTLRAPEGLSPKVLAFFDEVAASTRAAQAPAAPAEDVEAPPDAPVGGLTAGSNRQGATPTAAPPGRGAARVAPWVLGGTSVALAATGLVFGLRARGFEREVRTNPWMDERLALAGQAQQSATAANVSYAAAGTTAVAAAVVWFLTREDAPPPVQ